MITKWKVFNFKSICDETELELAPLTIFAGANSSGKSTFLQTILLIAQTLAHKVGSRSVVLNGTLTSLGQFDDLKSNGSASDQITIKCTCKPLEDSDGVISNMFRRASSNALYYRYRFNQLQEINFELSFDADASSPQRETLQIQPRLFSTQLSCTFRDDDNVDQKANITIHPSTKTFTWKEDAGRDLEIDAPLRASLAYDVDVDDDSMAEIKDDFRSAKPIGCMIRHFLPERIVYTIDTLEEDANAITMALQDDNYRGIGIRRAMKRKILLSKEILSVLREVLKGTLDFDLTFKDKFRQESLFGSDSETITLKDWYEKLRSLPHGERMRIQQVLREREDLFDLIHQAMKASMVGQPETIAFVQASPPRLITEATKYLDNFFTSAVKYLGPLRDAPKPLYPLAPAADPYDVGLRGEHTASILELHKNKMIRYIPSKNFKQSIVDCTLVSRTLETAVTDWLQYLGVASSVQSRDLGKLGHELKVGLPNSDGTHDLTHVGVGVSQILPILVMCFLAETDATLVFEQPELHLHPKVQTLLGDFFLSMELSNKQCIVETHSEYLIDRIRFRIAAASPAKDLNRLTKIYFVEKPSQSSVFREVVVNEYGAILDWPEGFFDQSQQQAEEILLAATRKRQEIRRRKESYAQRNN